MESASRNVVFETTRPGALLPVRGTPHSAGWDVFSPEERLIKPGGADVIWVGLRVSLPADMWMEIRSRSGLAFKHGIHVYHGVIDSDYTGEIAAKLYNHGETTYRVVPGDRIAQFVFHVYDPNVVVSLGTVDRTDRGGFGSTGK